MENLGDWLYITLLVIAGIGSLLGSGKKKKQSQQTSDQPSPIPDYERKTQQEEEPGSFWDMFDDIPKEQPHPQQPKPVIQPQRIQPIIHSKPVNTPVYTSETDNNQDDPFEYSESFHDTEELKKAIIYSEILNRKY